MLKKPPFLFLGLLILIFFLLFLLRQSWDEETAVSLTAIHSAHLLNVQIAESGTRQAEMSTNEAVRMAEIEATATANADNQATLLESVRKLAKIEENRFLNGKQPICG